MESRTFAFKKGTMREDDYTFQGKQAQLIKSAFSVWQKEVCVLNYGAILLCKKGSSSISVNFETWQLHEGSVIVLFPNDVVLLTLTTDDFEVYALCYTSSMLREASLQLESAVYDSLSKDRCQTDSEIPRKLIQYMFDTLALYFSQKDCTCVTQLVLLQLKGFFLGFYDFLLRHPSKQQPTSGSQRTNELFQRFYALIRLNYKKSRDVSYYADLLHITPKYLNSITHQVTRLSSKVIIDHYVVLQLQLQLRNSPDSIKEIAWDYNFSNLSFFCRYFKKHTGTTPKQYQKEK